MADIDSALSVLRNAGMTEDEIASRLRGDKVGATREHFGKLLKNDANIDVVTLTITDWRAIREFLREPPTQRHNPGGQMFDDLKRDTREAIKERDAQRLILNLLLLYKAVRFEGD